ncbi:E3 ubiquitin-protein ligase RING1 [Bienertia sinuspersici]
MAEVSFLQFPEEDHDLFAENDLLIEEITTLDSFRCWSNIPTSDCFSPHQLAIDDVEDEFFASNLVSGQSIGSDSTDNILFEDRKNQVNFVMDLFHQRVEQSHAMGRNEIVSETVNDSNFGVIEENFDVGSNDLDLELRLGLGLGLEDDDEEDSNCGGFVVTDCGDEFYIARRENATEIRNDNEIPSSSSRVGGLMVVGVDSDSEVEEEGNESLRFHVHSEEEFGVDYEHDDIDDDVSIPLCWDSFQLEEEDDQNRVYNNDFEWEEVDDRAVDTEAMSSSDLGLIISGPEENGVGERERERGEFGHLTWEVLLDVNNIGRNSEMMENVIDIDDQEDDIFNAAEYELMFGQFAESESAFSGRPPASKTVVEKLPTVITTEEDVLNEKSLCAVCKDQIEVGKEGKLLPCSHRYHGDCIIPWLGIRNTCPVCRFELPTDDSDYEQRRVRRLARGV